MGRRKIGRLIALSLIFVLILAGRARADEPQEEPAAQAESETAPAEQQEPPPSVGAAEEEPEYQDFAVYTLGEIVVTADKPAVRDISISNEVTAEDIEATNSRTVAEAMKYVPGVAVSAGRKNEPEISIHGLNQRKTLILIDGVPYYETNYGKLDLNQIPTDIIARIDVVKGAPSVLYGPNAEVGVINIITKKGTGKPTFSANFEAGDEHYYRTSFTHGNSVGMFYYWLNYTHREADGYPLSDDFDPQVGDLILRPGGTVDEMFENGGRRENSDYNTDSVWAKFGIEPDEDSEYYVNLSYIDTERGFPASVVENRVILFIPPFSQLARFDRYNDFNVDLSGREKISDALTLQAKLFYHEHVDDYASYSDITFTEKLAVSRFKDYYVGGSVFADIQPIDWDVVRLAFHYKEDSHKQRDDRNLPFDESKSHTGSVAIENEFNLIENLSIVLGASYDWFKVTDAEEDQMDVDTAGTTDAFNPMIGAVYTFPDSTKLFGSVAKKTRFPTLQQLSSGDPANWDLDPEESVNYTIGVSRPLCDIAVAELAYFFHDIDDWITRDFPLPDEAYHNIAKVEIQGIEFTTEVYPLENLTLRFGYAFLDAEDKSFGRVTDRVVHIPKHKVDLGATYEVPCTRTRIDLTSLFVDETYSQLPTPFDPTDEVLKSDDYYIMNARVTQPFKEHFEFYVAVNNIFDKNYEPEYGFPAAGRNWWVGVTARF